MFSIELKKTGKVTVDLDNLSVLDVRNLLDVKKKSREGDEILSKAVSLSADEIGAMPYPEYRKLTRFFWECVNDPLKNEDNEKNSLSESGSE